jgi:hypothetical protein
MLFMYCISAMVIDINGLEIWVILAANNFPSFNV